MRILLIGGAAIVLIGIACLAVAGSRQARVIDVWLPDGQRVQIACTGYEPPTSS